MCRPTNPRNTAKFSKLMYVSHDDVIQRSVARIVPQHTDRQVQQHHPWQYATTLRRSPETAIDIETNSVINTSNDVDVIDNRQDRLNRIVNRARTVVQTLNYRQRFLLFVKMLTAFIEKHYRQSSSNNNKGIDSNANDATVSPPPILLAVRNVLVDCIHRYRAGDQNYMPLEETISMRLQDVAGIQLYWNLTRDYLGYDLCEEHR
jgi:hypothetical protein